MTGFRFGGKDMKLAKWEKEIFQRVGEVTEEMKEKFAKEHLSYDHKRTIEVDSRVPPSLASAIQRGTNANELLSPTMLTQEWAEREMWRTLVIETFSISPYAWEMLNAHMAGDVYIHKLPESAYLQYCVGHDTSKYLKKGLINFGDHRSSPPKHFVSAVNQGKEFLIGMQGYFTGAQAFGSVETWWAPFVRKDKLDYREIKQGIQTFYFEINHPWRTGGQSPFTNNTVLLMSSDVQMYDRNAVIDGKTTPDPLGDFVDEATQILTAIFEVEYEGDAEGRPFTFPIQNVMMTEKLIKHIDAHPELFRYFWGSAGKMGAQYFENAMSGTTNALGEEAFIDPNSTLAMCYHKEDKLLIKDGDKIDYVTFEELFERYAGDSDGDGWYKVNKQFQVLAIDPKTGDYKWARVKAIRRQKARNSKIAKIELADGRYIRVDLDHMLRYYDGETPKLEQLERVIDKITGIRLPVILTELNDGEYINVDGITINEETAYILGVLYADGHADKRNGRWYIRFYLSTKKKEIIERVINWLMKHGIGFRIYYGPHTEEIVRELVEKYNVKTHALPQGKSYTNNIWVDINISELQHFFEKAGIRVNKAKNHEHIPWVIWSSPLSVRKAFIEGFIDTDGYKRNGHVEVHLGGVSRRFAEELSLLCHLSGYRCTIAFRNDGTINIIVNKNGNLQRTRHSLKLGEMSLVKVRSITIENYNDYVYDVEIDSEVKDYVVNMGVVNHDCCRLLVEKPKVEAHGVFSIGDETGSKGIVTINLPRFALKANGDIDKMLQLVEEYMVHKVAPFLVWWHKYYMWLRWKGAPALFAFPNAYQKFEDFEYNFFMTFGAMGMPEMANILADEHWSVWQSDDYTTKFRLVRDYIKPVIQKMKEIANAISDAHGTKWGTRIRFNVEEVPAETASSKLFRKDLKHFGKEKLQKYVNFEVGMYSNTIVPYYMTGTILQKAELEGLVQRDFTGGVMHHFWLAEPIDDPEFVKKLVLAIMSKGVINFSLSPKICIGDQCWTRIVGWMRPISNFNDFRKQEFGTRYFHSMDGLKRFNAWQNYKLIEEVKHIDPFAGL